MNGKEVETDSNHYIKRRKSSISVNDCDMGQDNKILVIHIIDQNLIAKLEANVISSRSITSQCKS